MSLLGTRVTLLTCLSLIVASSCAPNRVGYRSAPNTSGAKPVEVPAPTTESAERTAEQTIASAGSVEILRKNEEKKENETRQSSNKESVEQMFPPVQFNLTQPNVVVNGEHFAQARNGRYHAMAVEYRSPDPMWTRVYTYIETRLITYIQAGVKVADAAAANKEALDYSLSIGDLEGARVAQYTLVALANPIAGGAVYPMAMGSYCLVRRAAVQSNLDTKFFGTTTFADAVQAAIQWHAIVYDQSPTLTKAQIIAAANDGTYVHTLTNGKYSLIGIVANTLIRQCQEDFNAP